MGRKKKRPTKVVSARIPKSDYEMIVIEAKKAGKSISQMWKEIIKRSMYRN